MARAITIVIDAETGSFKQKIDSVIQQTNRLSQDAIRGSQQTRAAFEQSQGALGGLERRAISTRAAFGPLSSALSQGTQLLGQYSPAAGAAAGALDNLAISVLATATATGGLRGVLAAAAGLLNPWVALVIAGGAALAYFSAQSAEAKKKEEEFQQALRTNNLDVLKERVKTVNDELKKTEDHYERILVLQAQQAAPPGSPLARAQEQGLDPLRKKLGEASRASEQADRDLANAQRNKALEGKDERLEQLRLQKELAEANERARPGIQARADIQALLNKGLKDEEIVTERLLILQRAAAQEREIDKRAGEEAARKLQQQLEEQQRAQAEALKSVLQHEQALNLEIVGFRDGAVAAEALKLALLETNLAQTLGAEGAAAAVDRLKTLTATLRGLKEEREREAQLQKDLRLVAEQAARDYEEEIAFVEKLTALKRQEAEAEKNFPLQKLRASGAREGEILQEQLRLLREREQFIKNAPEITVEENRELPQVLRDIEIAETRLQRFGAITLDLGQHIANTFDTIFTAMISGTLKSVDAGRTLVATLGHIVTDTFRQVIQKKLAFEFDLFNNLRGLPAQAGQALAAGGASVPDAGGGGFLSNIFGGGGGGLFGTGVGLGGILTSGIGGLVFSSLLGGTGLQHGLSAAGSIGGSLLGGTGLGSTILTGVFDALTAGGTTGLFGFGGAAAAGVVGDLLGSFLLPGIGSILGFLFGSLFKKKPPKSVLAVETTGDLLTQFGGLFQAGDIESVVTRAKRTGGAGTTIEPQLEGLGLAMAQGVADLLNTFDETIRGALDRQVAESNEAARQVLSFTISGRGKKFSRKLQAFMNDLPGNLLNAFDPVITEAFQQQLEQLGFARRTESVLGGVLKGTAEERLTGLGGLADLLAKLKPVLEFSTQAERAGFERGIGPLFETGSGQNLQAAVQRFSQQFADEFEKSEARRRLGFSLAQALVDGMNGLDPNQAFATFRQGFGQVISETLQQALVSGFVVKNLAPILTGPLADIQGIFGGIGAGLTGPEALAQAQPHIDLLSDRLGALSPIFQALIELFRELNRNIQERFAPGTAAAGGTIEINVDGSGDPREVARQIELLIKSRGAPVV